MNRRNFIVLATAGLLCPVALRAAPKKEPDFAFDDIGPRGVGKMTEKEQRAVKIIAQDYLGIQRIRWGIPGNRENIQTFTAFDDNYLVRWKKHPNQRTVYIEVERTFTGEPTPYYSSWIDTVLKQFGYNWT